MIPYGHQDITNADIDAVISVLNSDFLNFAEELSAQLNNQKFSLYILYHKKM